jgi:hypothetical protein
MGVDKIEGNCQKVKGLSGLTMVCILAYDRIAAAVLGGHSADQ